jgi:DNA-binding beta-propeller fold protein YncE
LAFPGKVLATNAGLFIADSGHHRIVMSSENGEILHLIGTGKPGLTDGSFQQAQFSAPQGMAFDPENQLLYVADRRFPPNLGNESTNRHCKNLSAILILKKIEY